MKSLLDLKRPSNEQLVMISDSEGFTVRGLTPAKVFTLYQRHTDALSELFEAAMENVRTNGAAGSADIENVVIALLRDAPVLLSELIVLANSDDDLDEDAFAAFYEVARQLTFPVQVDAVAKIAEATFTSDMPPGKFLTLVVGMLTRATGTIFPVT